MDPRSFLVKLAKREETYGELKARLRKLKRPAAAGALGLLFGSYIETQNDRYRAQRRVFSNKKNYLDPYKLN